MGIIKYFEYFARGAYSLRGISEFDLDIFSRETRGNKNYVNRSEEKLREEYQKTCKDLGKNLENLISYK